MLDIIYVEDNKELQEDVMDLLVTHGYQAKAFDSAEACWEFIHTVAPPKLLITDCDLPNASGLDLISYIRRKSPKNLDALPVIMLSSHFDNQSLRASIATLGVKCLIPKPFNAERFIKEVQRILET